MKIFNYHPQSGILLGESVADESPLEEGVFLVPAFATINEPPAETSGKMRVFSGDQWILLDIPEPEPIVPPPPSVVMSVTALQGLLAIDASGLAQQYDAWAGHAERTFAERAFINKAQIWKRDDPTLVGAAAALGLSSAQVDAMFELASTL